MTTPPGVSPIDTDLPVLGQDDGGLTTLTTPMPLPSIPFDAPLVNPAQIGLYPLVDWDEAGGPSRFLGEGVYVRPFNYGGAAAFGVWGAAWCGDVERITISGTGGTWTYTYNDSPTGTLANNITADNLQRAIDALPNVDDGQIYVSSPSAGIYLVSHSIPGTTSVDGASLTGTNAGATIDPVRKEGERPDDGEPFGPITVWAADECGPGPASEAEQVMRAQQNLRLLEPVAVERELAERMLFDAAIPGAIPTRATLISGIAYLEGILAETGTVGIIHASAEWAAVAASSQLLPYQQTVGLKTRLGHQFAFGGGYVDGLGTTLVATSSVFGWRDEVVVRTAMSSDPYDNRVIAIAERSVVVAYEELIGAVTVTTGP
jgi:hypothetical protein